MRLRETKKEARCTRSMDMVEMEDRFAETGASSELMKIFRSTDEHTTKRAREPYHRKNGERNVPKKPKVQPNTRVGRG